MRCWSRTSLTPRTVSGGVGGAPGGGGGGAPGGGSAGGGGGGGLQGGIGVGEHVVDQADLLGAVRVDVLAGQRQLAQVAVGQDQRQPGQATHVGDDSQLDLANRELR